MESIEEVDQEEYFLPQSTKKRGRSSSISEEEGSIDTILIPDENEQHRDRKSVV